jgi:hypothetical protein
LLLFGLAYAVVHLVLERRRRGWAGAVVALAVGSDLASCRGGWVMNVERDTWPPRVGQGVWIKPTDEAAVVLELLPDGWVKVEPYPMVRSAHHSTRARPADYLRDLAEVRQLDELRPEFPHLVPEWQGTLD